LVQVTEVHTQLQHSIGQLASVLQPDSVTVGRKEGKLEIWRSSAAAVGSVDAKSTSVRSCPSLRRGTYEYFEVQQWQRTMHYHLLPMLNSCPLVHDVSLIANTAAGHHTCASGHNYP
jgi:hypothetical protein